MADANSHPPTEKRGPDGEILTDVQGSDAGWEKGVVQEVGHGAADGEIDEFALAAEGEQRTSWFIWMLVLCCSISGLLFGASFGLSQHYGNFEPMVKVMTRV